MDSSSAVQVSTPATSLETSNRSAMVIDVLVPVLDEPALSSQVAQLASPLPFLDSLPRVGSTFAADLAAEQAMDGRAEQFDAAPASVVEEPVSSANTRFESPASPCFESRTTTAGTSSPLQFFFNKLAPLVRPSLTRLCPPRILVSSSPQILVSNNEPRPPVRSLLRRSLMPPMRPFRSVQLINFVSSARTFGGPYLSSAAR